MDERNSELEADKAELFELWEMLTPEHRAIIHGLVRALATADADLIELAASDGAAASAPGRPENGP